MKSSLQWRHSIKIDVFFDSVSVAKSVDKKIFNTINSQIIVHPLRIHLWDAFYIERVVTEIVSILFFIMGHVFKKIVVFINYISSLLLICRILDDIILDVFQRDFISNHMIIKPGLPFEIRVFSFVDCTGDSGFAWPHNDWYWTFFLWTEFIFIFL